MLKTLRFLILLPLALLLSACITMPVSTQDAFQPASDSAVVLVGVYGTEFVRLFNEEDGTPYRMESKLEDVCAYSYPVGKSFKITRIVADATTAGVAYRHATLSKSPSLTPDKVGIFYYGTIASAGGKVFVSDKPVPELLKKAKEKYKNVFEKLAPANFE